MTKAVVSVRDRVREYKKAHPKATTREIQSALKISSASLVYYHLNTETKTDRIKKALGMARDALGRAPGKIAKEALQAVTSAMQDMEKMVHVGGGRPSKR